MSVHVAARRRDAMTPDDIVKDYNSASEHAHQSAFFCACQQAAKTDSIWNLIFAIPNGGLRDKVTAARMKAEGVKSGVPDIFIAVARGRYHGCFLEMKLPNAPDSDIKPAQQEWLEALRVQGYAAAVARGWKHAFALAEQYLFWPIL